MEKKEKYIVCAALPYANGASHIGHLAGAYVPADIFTRCKRMEGHNVHFVCGTDEFGAAITIRGFQEKRSPQEVVDHYHTVIRDEFVRCGIKFDVFSRTTRPYHIARAQDFFLNLKKNGLIESKTEDRLFCSSCEQFLPDRYVIGECPSCHKPGARGDQCEKCGAWFEPETLINPICQICKKTKASLKATTHWYLLLDKLDARLKEWIESKTTWRSNVLGYARQPLKAGLVPRCITRDLTWGVPVPLPEAKGKVLYVWIDAPIGYISASEEWAINQGKPDAWREYWEDKNSKLVHFVGKDNIVFHTVVWPALLMGDGRYVLPHLVAGNEFLNLEGEKISTSRNFAVWTKDALDLLPADILRFYLTSIAPETGDSDFSWKDLQSRVNTELADTIGNLANRTLSFINKNYAGIATEDQSIDGEIIAKVKATYAQYSALIDQGYVRAALGEVVSLGRYLNTYLQNAAPWSVRKTDPKRAQMLLHSTCVGIKSLALLLAPVTPTIAQRLWDQLGFSTQVGEQSFREIESPLPKNHAISNTVAPIVAKIEDDFVAAQIAKLRPPPAS